MIKFDLTSFRGIPSCFGDFGYLVITEILNKSLSFRVCTGLGKVLVNSSTFLWRVQYPQGNCIEKDKVPKIIFGKQ